MLYPRMTRLIKKNTLVPDSAMVSYKEHLTSQHRILFLTGTMTGETESHNLLLALDTLSHDPIKLVITSGGGELDSTFLFYDTMRMIQSPIDVVGRYCASAAVLLLAAGRKRYLFPHAKVMLHLPTGQMGGDPRDFEIQHRQMEMYQDKIIDILHECGVKKSREEILTDIDREYWLEPQQAIDYGLCDGIMTPGVWQDWIRE